MIEVALLLWVSPFVKFLVALFIALLIYTGVAEYFDRHPES